MRGLFRSIPPTRVAPSWAGAGSRSSKTTTCRSKIRKRLGSWWPRGRAARRAARCAGQGDVGRAGHGRPPRHVPDGAVRRVWPARGGCPCPVPAGYVIICLQCVAALEQRAVDAGVLEPEEIGEADALGDEIESTPEEAWEQALADEVPGIWSRTAPSHAPTTPTTSTPTGGRRSSGRIAAADGAPRVQPPARLPPFPSGPRKGVTRSESSPVSHQ